MRCRHADVRMIDHDQVVALGQFIQRIRFEIFQQPGFPAQCDDLRDRGDRRMLKKRLQGQPSAVTIELVPAGKQLSLKLSWDKTVASVSIAPG